MDFNNNTNTSDMTNEVVSEVTVTEKITDMFDFSKINIDTNNQVVTSDPLTISYIGNVLKFNIIDILPVGAFVKQYSLNLFSDKKIVETGLNLVTNKALTGMYNNLTLRGQLVYEYGGSSFQIGFNNAIGINTTTSISVQLENLAAPDFSSNEDVINYLVAEIEGLKKQVIMLQLTQTSS